MAVWIFFIILRFANQIGLLIMVVGSIQQRITYAAFALYESGLLNKQELIKELRTYTLVDQLLMHTAESLKSITFIEAKEIKL